MILVAADIIAGTLILTTNTWIPSTLATFFGVFLLVKGVTTVTGPMIWFGPLAFFGGVVDIVVGTTLYLTLAFGGVTGQLYALVTGIEIVKGFLTVALGLIM